MIAGRQRIFQWITLALAALLLTVILLAPRSRQDERFLGMSPEQASVTLALNYMGNDQGPMKGIKMLDRISELHPENTIAIARLAEFSMQTGQFQKAVGRFEALVNATKGEEQVNALLGLSDAAFMAGDTAKSLSALQKVFQISKDSLLLQSAKEKINALQ